MLSDVDKAPTFEYIPNKYDFYYGKIARAYSWTDDEDDDYYSYNWGRSNTRQCVNCHRLLPEDDIFPVKSRNWKGERHYYCLDCVGLGINWCEKCGEPFEVTAALDTLCPDCAGKDLPRPTVL